MVEFKARIYDGDNNQMIGAEITVYSREGDNIGSIQVTSKQQFDNLIDRLDSIDERFISKSELQNEVDNLIINANTLSGFSSTDFALNNHTHENEYARTNHADAGNTFGLGSNSLYGHVKLIDNCNQSDYRDGEALSAKQGKILNDKIDSEIQNISASWREIKSNDYYDLHYNPIMKLVWFRYHRADYTGFVNSVGNKTMHVVNSISSTYAPRVRMNTPIYRGDVVIYVDPDGSISVYSLTKFSKINLHAGMMWPIF